VGIKKPIKKPCRIDVIDGIIVFFTNNEYKISAEIAAKTEINICKTDK